MADSECAGNGRPNRSIGLLGAVFIGIGAMVGAGIFALFGQAGSIAGAAVWVSFLAGGIIALLQGYSFAKLGARYPSAGGLIDWIARGYGNGLFAGGLVVLAYLSVMSQGAMVAASFGHYAARLLFAGEASPVVWKALAILLIGSLALLNAIGARVVTRAQTVVVMVVIVVLSGFAVAMLLRVDPILLAPSGYPPVGVALASVALTFFAYLGFGLIAFTGGDIRDPHKNLPRAMYISIGFAMLLYVSLAIGVFGTLTVQEVIADAETALAVAAMPTLGVAGYTMITIAAVFASTGALNSMLYASIGATRSMAENGHLPARFGADCRHVGGTQGLVISALVMIALAALFDVTAIASLGSAVALAIFALITVAHLRIAEETGASRLLLALALATTGSAIVLFGWFTFHTAPATFAILVVAIALAWIVEGSWMLYKKRPGRAKPGVR